nr:40S ribosomal protein S15a-1 [Ipomoea batatas]
MEKEASRRTEAVSVYNNIGKELILNSILHFFSCFKLSLKFVDHRAGKIVVELNGRLNKCGVISLRFDIGVKDIEGWTARLLLSRQSGNLLSCRLAVGSTYFLRLVSGDEQCQRFLVALMINYHHDDIMTYLSLSPGIFAGFSIAAGET